MNRNLLSEVIHNYSRHLHKLYERIPGHFEVEDIHEWRVGYKKLRTFLRLMNTANHLPSAFKHLFKASGEIRDKQLLINSFPDLDTKAMPVYLNRLAQELFIAKEQFVCIGEDFSFEKMEKKFLDKLPDYLSDEQLKRFVAEKKGAVRLALLAKENDLSLHTIRKHLKDLLYAEKLYDQQWGLHFPVPIGISEKVLSELTQLAGDYNDLCIQVDFLKADNTLHLPSMEAEIIRKYLVEWEGRKDAAKRELLNKINSHLSL